MSTDFKNDPHWGKGGQFVVIDGKRVPANQAPTATPDTPAVPETTPVADPAAESKPAKKGK